MEIHHCPLPATGDVVSCLTNTVCQEYVRDGGLARWVCKRCVRPRRRSGMERVLPCGCRQLRSSRGLSSHRRAGPRVYNTITGTAHNPWTGVRGPRLILHSLKADKRWSLCHWSPLISAGSSLEAKCCYRDARVEGFWSVKAGLHLFIGLLRNVHVTESPSAEGEFNIWCYCDGFGDVT